jgi:hypothetical protein
MWGKAKLTMMTKAGDKNTVANGSTGRPLRSMIYLFASSGDAVRIVILTIAALLFAVFMRWFAPHTVLDLILQTGALVSLVAAAGSLSVRGRFIFLASVAVVGFVAGTGWSHDGAREIALPPQGFIISMVKDIDGNLLLVDLSVDGEHIDMKRYVAKGVFEPFEQMGVMSGDRDLVIQWDRPFSRAHLTYALRPGGAGISIAYRTRLGQRLEVLPTKANGWDGDQRYYFSAWELPPFWAKLFLGLLFMLGGFFVSSDSHRRLQHNAIPATFGFALIGFIFSDFPGLLSNDSISQYAQCTTGNYFDWQSVVHSVLMCSTRYVLDSPFLFVVLQAAAYMLVILFLLHGLERQGAWREILGDRISLQNLFRLTIMSLAFSGIVMPTLTFLAPEVLFGLCIILALLLIGRFILVTNAVIYWIALSTALSGVLLFRTEGVIFILILLVIALAIKFEGRRLTVLASVTSLCVLAGYKELLAFLAVPGAADALKLFHLLELPINTIADALSKGMLSDPAQLAVAHSIFVDTARIRTDFDPWLGVVKLDWIRMEALRSAFWPILSAWWAIIKYHPILAISAAIEHGWVVFLPFEIVPTPVSVFPTFSDVPRNWAMVGMAPPFSSVSWTPAFSNLATAIRIRISQADFYPLLAPSMYAWVAVIFLVLHYWLRNRAMRTRVALDKPAVIALVTGLMFFFATGFIIPGPLIRIVWYTYPISAIACGLLINSLTWQNFERLPKGREGG